jgi:O-antigen ligase
MASFAATAFASYVAFHDRRAMSEERIVRQHFPRRFFQTTGGSDLLIAALAQFGFFAAMIGVLAYYTSPGKLLWFFPSPYPDTWGFFLSRNNFAQFLELALPAALWRARHGATASIAVAAAMLAAGQASASRAGAVLLIVETVACLLMMRGMMRGSRRLSRSMPDRRSLISTAWKLAAALAMFVTITGVGQLWGRLREADPFQYRREIAHSTMAMIAAHPWRGFGLGTFPAVYPAYAEFDAGAVVDHAHNDWLEWASEGGWPFAAAWGVLAIAVFRPAAQSVWGIGIIVVFLHGLVDYPFARFGVSAWTFLLIGAVTATQRERIASRRLLSR